MFCCPDTLASYLLVPLKSICIVFSLTSTSTPPVVCLRYLRREIHTYVIHPGTAAYMAGKGCSAVPSRCGPTSPFLSSYGGCYSLQQGVSMSFQKSCLLTEILTTIRQLGKREDIKNLPRAWTMLIGAHSGSFLRSRSTKWRVREGGEAEERNLRND